MSSHKKKEKKDPEGNSQFTRSKLESQYNPKYRFFKHQLMSFNQMSDKDKHQFKAKEEYQICDKAIKHLKTGSNLVIDWNTRSNFRTTTTKSALPKIKTEPSEMHASTPTAHAASVNSLTPIEQKRMQLARLLHVRHKKHYLQTKRESQQQKTLFGSNHSVNRTDPSTSHQRLSNRKSNYSYIHSAGKNSKNNTENIEKIQEQIMKQSKLQILKDELKTKFQQIRHFLQKSQKKQKKSFMFFD